MKESIPSLPTVEQKNTDEAWLEDQFKNIETLNIDGHPLRVLDISPQEAKSETPVVLAPSYGSFSPLGKKVNISEMVRQKRRVLFVDEPRGIARKDDKEKPAEIEEFFLRQTEALLAVLDEKGIGKADVVGHSEGCIYAVVAASLYPERFRNIVLFNPGGMIGDDTFVKLGYRFLTDGVASLIKMNKRKRKGEISLAAQEQMKEGDAGFIKYLDAEKVNSLNEVRAMAKAQIRNLLKQAHEKGVGISIVHGVDDSVFPMKRVLEQVSRANPEEDLIVDGFYSVKGRHGEFLMDPEKYTQVADIALTALEERPKKAESKVNIAHG